MRGDCPLKHSRHGRVEPAIDLACALASLLMAESHFDQMQDCDQATRTFRDSQRVKRSVRTAGSDRHRLGEWALTGDELDRVVKVHCIKAERDVGRAALPVPCVQTSATPAEIPWHKIAVAGAECQRNVTMGPFDTLHSELKGRADHGIDYALNP